MRILYVEDNATNVILVQRVANMGKHSVITYDNGEEALANFDQDTPDCVLLDVQLRGALTGLDVVAKLRERGLKLPIIALTAYAMKGDRQRCLDAGCDDYIPKPISVTELVSVFKRFNDAITSSRKATIVGGRTPFFKPSVEIVEVKPPAQTAAAASEPTPLPAQPAATETALPPETPSAATVSSPTVQPLKTIEDEPKGTVNMEPPKEETRAQDVSPQPPPPVDAVADKAAAANPANIPTSVES